MSLEAKDVARRLRSEAKNTLDLELFEILTFAADALDGHAIAAGSSCQLVPVVVDLTNRLRHAEAVLFQVVAERDELLEIMSEMGAER